MHQGIIVYLRRMAYNVLHQGVSERICSSFFNLPPTTGHLHLLQAENCDSNLLREGSYIRLKQRSQAYGIRYTTHGKNIFIKLSLTVFTCTQHTNTDTIRLFRSLHVAIFAAYDTKLDREIQKMTSEIYPNPRGTQIKQHDSRELYHSGAW